MVIQKISLTYVSQWSKKITQTAFNFLGNYF